MHAKRQKGIGQQAVQAKVQRHKGSWPLPNVALYPLKAVKQNAWSIWDGHHQCAITADVSPSASMRCHRRGLEHKIRDTKQAGWWLGYLTISGLGTLTALQITSNFASNCTYGSLYQQGDMLILPRRLQPCHTVELVLPTAAVVTIVCTLMVVKCIYIGDAVNGS